MNDSAAASRVKELRTRTLAPVVPMKTLSGDVNNKKRNPAPAKASNNQHQAYNKAIYRAKKYDLL